MARRRMTSIVRQVRISVTTIALLLILPVIGGLVTTIIYSEQYQAMIRRMDRAAEQKPVVETTLAENMFAVAAGRSSFADSGAEKLIARVDGTLDELLAETSGNGHLQLTVARRTMETLEQYILKVRDGMAEGIPIDEIIEIVDEIRKIGAQVADMVDAFIGQEILNARATSTRLNRVVLMTAGAEFLLLILALFYTRFAMNRLTDNIRTALSSLETTVRRIAEGDLRDRVSDLGVEELQELAEHINQMAERLETLIAETKRNQEHLAKAELRTLQAQINPHFLYNTLDAIVWQAESGKGDEVVRLTRNLSDFFPVLRRRLDPGNPGTETCIRLPEHPADPVPGHPDLRGGFPGGNGKCIHAEAAAAAAGGERAVPRHQGKARRWADYRAHAGGRRADALYCDGYRQGYGTGTAEGNPQGAGCRKAEPAGSAGTGVLRIRPA